MFALKVISIVLCAFNLINAFVDDCKSKDAATSVTCKIVFGLYACALAYVIMN